VNVEYPERTKRIKMLRFLLDELRKAYSRGEGRLALIYHGLKKGYNTGDVTIEATGVSIPRLLGLSAPECASLLGQLHDQEYIALALPEDAEDEWQERDPFRLYYLTDKGLREIGELPDPQAQLIQGFEAAIEAIKYDRSLTDREKRQKINWLQEGTVIARTLSMEAIKAILAGAFL
jgi:hypothetical protein